MRLDDVAFAPWALAPEAFDTVQAVIARHLRGESADLSAIQAQLGRPLANERQPVAVRDGVAVVPIQGVLAKRANLLMEISGGTSSQIAANQVRAAAADSAIRAIVLDVDSPGGTVDGTQALADAVRAVRGVKPIAAVIDGTGASAAYWVASAADAVYLADETSAAGSIGVIATHRDVSGAEAQRGVRTTQVTSGPYKGQPSPYAPLNDDGRALLQRHVDAMHAVFASAVARNRGLSDAAIARVADGRSFLGRDAIAAGLADDIRPLEAVVRQLAAGRIEPRGATAAEPALTPRQVADKARAYRAQQAAAGRRITVAQAVHHVLGSS